MISPAVAQLSGNWQVSPATALLAVGGLMLYVASRAAADALAGADPARPGLRALGHCLPIAAVALLCLNPSMGRANLDEMTVGRPQVAVGLLFGSSVAVITLVLGVASYLVPLAIAPLPPTRRAWPFVLPAALLLLVAGFNGRLTWLHAVMLTVLGGAVLNLWVGGQSDASDDAGTPHAADNARPHVMTPARWGQFSLAAALTVLGAWAVARGVAGLEQTHRVLTGVVLAGAVLSPLLTLPVLGSASRIAERGHTGSVISTLVAMVLINLCGVLPLVIATHHVLALLPRNAPEPATATLQPAPAATNPATAPTSAPTTSPTTAPATAPKSAADVIEPPTPDPAIPFPIVCWRVDTVVLAVIGFAMIPWALGRWSMSRVESVVLIFAYAIYLAMITFLSTRWR